MILNIAPDIVVHNVAPILPVVTLVHLLQTCKHFHLLSIDRSEIEFFKNLFINNKFSRGFGVAIFHRDLELASVFSKYVTRWNMALEGAAKIGDLPLVQKYAEKLTPKQCKGASYEAGRAGNLDVVKYLITRGGHAEIVKLILNYKNDHQLWTALKCAALGGHRHIMEILVYNGAESDEHTLRDAARSGNMDVVNYCIDKLKITDWDAGLEGAYGGNHPKLIEFFISKGANVAKAQYHQQYFLDADEWCWKKLRIRLRDFV